MTATAGRLRRIAAVSPLRRIAAAGLLATTAWSCAGAQRALPTAGPQTVAGLLAALQVPRTQTLQGEARLEAYVQGDRRSVALLVLAKRSAAAAGAGQLQFQALAPTLDMLALLSTDGRHFTSFERGGEFCLVGRACPANLARLLPVALPAGELVATLLGDPPRPDASDPQTRLGWDGEHGLYRIESGPPAGRHQHLFVYAATLRPAGVVWFDGARRVASVQYDGEVAAGGPPRTVRFKAAQPAADVSIELRDVQLDQPLDDGVFAVACPSGMVVRELPCEDAALPTPAPAPVQTP